MRRRAFYAGILSLFLGGDAVQPLSRMSVPSQIKQATDTADSTGIRIGVVTSFTAGSITVAISGTDTLVNATYLASYFPSQGDLVAVLKYGASWLVLGTMGQTQSRYIPVSARVATTEGTTNTSYVDLATVGPSVTVTIGSSGLARVSLGAYMTCAAPTPGGRAGVALSGANSVTPTFTNFTLLNFVQSEGVQIQFSNSREFLYSGLNPGSTTFKMVYASANGSLTNFSDRELTVTPY
jgi:hypothetical protein